MEQQVIAELAVKVPLSYLLGSVVGSLLIGKLRGGVDIRQLRSGTAGGTNTLRTQGRGFAFSMMVINIGKGWLATGVLARLLIPGISHRNWLVATITFSGMTDAAIRHQEQLASQEIARRWLDPMGVGWLGVACGIAAVLGHVYPIFHGFRGGKGVATLIGAVLGLNPWLLVPMLSTWLLAVVLFGFVGLASILATVALAVTAVMGLLSEHLPLLAQYVLFTLHVLGPQLPLFAFGATATLLIAFTHRSNIAHMRAGTEPRARRLWLFGSHRGGV
jgi:glycerol-3-phosphate acyltransferase PlsY